MKFSPADVDIFYQIQLSLFNFVNQQHQLFPELETPEDFKEFAGLERIDALREVCYANLGLLDQFVAANPDHLPDEHLEIARSWRYLKAGTFIIFRYLKKYTVFLDDGQPPKAYGVLGLYSDFDEILPMRPPMMAEAVLLPFRDRIVFDGILKPYTIYLGSGIRRRLKDAYRHAKERFGIITSLPHAAEGDEVVVQASHERALQAFDRWLAREYGLRPQTIERHVTNVRRFADHYLTQTDPCRSLYEITTADVRVYFRTLSPETSVRDSRVSFKKFLRFMRDTGRMPYREADGVYEVVRACK